VTDDAAAAAADAQRRYWGRILAATLRLARDVDIAEEATADAFVLALQTWPERGVPESVEAWLLTAARRRAIDRVRRAIAFRERLRLLAATGGPAAGPADVVVDAPVVGDDELRLVVLCCHPALAPEAQVALTMRLGCGIPTASVAAAFLVTEQAMAARLTRAKRRIAESGTGIDLPDDLAMEERMPAVRRTIHLAYTMGHTAGSGPGLRDDGVAAHAVRLARRLHALRPDDTEASGLLALVLLTEARAATRVGADGTQVLLAEADRRCWDRELTAEGLALVPDRPRGPLAVQAAIAAEHTRASTLEDTDWRRIVGLYDTLLSIEPSPTIAVGRCVALSYLLDAAAGLADLDEVLALGGDLNLERYPYAHAARAQMLGRLGRRSEAGEAWARAASSARTEAERTFFAAQDGATPSTTPDR
jgi:RNA polymerase sigma-70 factor, ECF subfamily